MDEWKEENRNLLLKIREEKNNTSHRIFIWFGSCVAFFPLRHCDVCFLCRVIWLWFFSSFFSSSFCKSQRMGSRRRRRRNVFFAMHNTHTHNYYIQHHIERNQKNGKWKKFEIGVACMAMDFYVPRFVRCQKFAILMYLVVSANIDVEMATSTTSQTAVLPSASNTICVPTDTHNTLVRGHTSLEILPYQIKWNEKMVFQFKFIGNIIHYYTDCRWHHLFFNMQSTCT